MLRKVWEGPHLGSPGITLVALRVGPRVCQAVRRHPVATEGWSCHPTASLGWPSSWDRAIVSPQLPLLLAGNTLAPQGCCHRGWSRDTSHISMDDT